MIGPIAPISFPSGPASGDLGGQYPSPDVEKIRGTEVEDAVAVDLDSFVFNSGTGLYEQTRKHSVISGTYANAAAREAVVTWVARDVGDVYQDDDTDACYMILSVAAGTATWSGQLGLSSLSRTIGTSDDLQAIVDGNPGKYLIEAGTHTVTTEIDFENMEGVKLIGEGIGRTIIQLSNNAFISGTAASTSYNIGAVNVGDDRFTCDTAGEAANFLAGDIVILSNAGFATPNCTNEVVSNNPGTGVVVCKYPIPKAILATGTVLHYDVVPLNGVEIRDLTIDMQSGANGGVIPLSFFLMKKSRLENIAIINCDALTVKALSILGTINCTFRNILIEDKKGDDQGVRLIWNYGACIDGIEVVGTNDWTHDSDINKAGILFQANTMLQGSKIRVSWCENGISVIGGYNMTLSDVNAFDNAENGIEFQTDAHDRGSVQGVSQSNGTGNYLKTGAGSVNVAALEVA